MADGLRRSCSPGLLDPGNSAFRRDDEGRGGSRKPLVGEFRFAGRPILLVNLHLRSKGGDDPIFGRRQPRIKTTDRRRTAQTRVVADFVSEVVKNDSKARIVVLGDLNDFENSSALEALEVAGLENLVKRLPQEIRYSYVYLGNSQVLDHVLVTESLTNDAEIEMVHVNAEFPATDRASDHDPVIVRPVDRTIRPASASRCDEQGAMRRAFRVDDTGATFALSSCALPTGRRADATMRRWYLRRRSAQRS